MSENQDYIIVSESSVNALMDSVNAIMDKYEPQGGLVFVKRDAGKITSLTVAQAMVKRRTVKTDEPVWEHAGEFGGEDVYQLTGSSIVQMRDTK